MKNNGWLLPDIFFDFQELAFFLANRVLTFHSLSRETVNTRENFWNVYGFATNQKRDETAKDNGQTAACIRPGSYVAFLPCRMQLRQ